MAKILLFMVIQGLIAREGISQMNMTIYSLITWNEFRNLIKTHFDISFSQIDDLCAEGIEWNSLENWLDADDLDILYCLESLKTFSGSLIVVTDASYLKGLSPFCVDSMNIKQFVENHFINFHQKFLETDAIIINFESNTAWLFHHEGVYGIAEFD